MKGYRKLFVCLPMFALPFVIPDFEPDFHGEMAPVFHSPEEVTAFHAMLLDTTLPDQFNELFAASGVCGPCHGYDTAGVASVDVFGNDVNVVDDWRATMMANSAKDPFWRAKVSHEVKLYPQHKAIVEDKCTSCHAPLGHFNAKHIGLAHYSMDDLANDAMGQDGVSCLACHQISPEGLGTTFSGNVHYDTFEVAYGPYTNPLVSPMLTETGYKPVYSPHTADAGLCASCHTLVTETVDYQGNFTGNKFVEQATYHEWLNSDFKDSVSCQGCHMPSLDKWPVRLVTGAQTKGRSPFFLHELVGGNVTMLKLLRQNIEPLDLKATTEQFDEVIANTLTMLRERSLHLDLSLADRTPDTAHFNLKLTNLAGHKFPSGYPSRRAFIEFLVKNEQSDTLFISGKTDSEFEVIGHDLTYEPHHQTIRSEDEVQIYEMVMGDVNGDVTTVLVRANQPLKDNRLAPKGFTTAHAVYDTTKIAGKALLDPDFNRENGSEGSGTDLIFYHVPLNGYYGWLEISAKVYYQPTPPKWMKEMFDHSTPEIDSFREMFANADRTPILTTSASLTADAISATSEKIAKKFVSVFPIPVHDRKLTLLSNRDYSLNVYALNGQLILSNKGQAGRFDLALPGKGGYLLQFTDNDGHVQTERIIVH